MKKIASFAMILLIVLSVFLIVTAEVEAQSEWVKYADNPVLNIGLSGSWDDLGVWACDVIFDGAAYKMWYSGHRTNQFIRIGLATSLDGITWTRYSNNPVLDVGPPGSWDDLQVGAPSVIFDGSVYRMWYYGNPYGPVRIGLATSTDGITWTKYAGNPVLSASGWEGWWVLEPEVLFDGSTYQMWYTGYDGTYCKIGYATSADGRSWTKYPDPVLSTGVTGNWDSLSVRSPSVVYDGSTYQMWYGGDNDRKHSRMGHATSTDGINWQKDSNNPVLDLGSNGRWDDWAVNHPTVISVGSTLKMWYSGHDGTETTSSPSYYVTIGLATLEGPPVEGVRALIINPKWNDVPSAYYPTVVNALNDLTIPYDIRDPDMLSLSILNEYDVVFLPELGHTQPGWESFDSSPLAAMLEDYVESGGGLLYAPGYLKYGTSPVVFAIQDLELRLDNVDLEISDNTHPVCSGFSVGERLYGNEADMRTYPADAGIIGNVKYVGSNTDEGAGLLTFQRGSGKVVVTAFQIGWMSSGPAIYNGVPAEKWETLTKNAILWLLTPIINQPPIAEFTFSPTSPDISDTVYFDASPSYDPDGSIISYEWDFGDEKAETGLTIEHKYKDEGTYTVTLTVTDNEGASGTTSVSINVIIRIHYELFIEIDYLEGHAPSYETLGYIMDYFEKQKKEEERINIVFTFNDEISLADWTAIDPDGRITKTEFLQFEDLYNNLGDDSIAGDGPVYDSKWKWVLYGNEHVDDAYGFTSGNEDRGNYIFIAKSECNQYASAHSAETTPEEVETVVLMHELGHSIGISVEDKGHSDPDGDGTSEDYDNDPHSVMNMIRRYHFNRVIDEKYSNHYWNEKNLLTNYEI